MTVSALFLLLMPALDEDEMSFYVVAFSKQNNNSLLWAEFTDFRGYCLEFDYEKIVEGFRHRVFLHGTVIYDEEEQMNGLLESLLSCIHSLVEKGAKDLQGFFEEDAIPSEESLNQLVDAMAVVCSVYTMFFKKSYFCRREEYQFRSFSIYIMRKRAEISMSSPVGSDFCFLYHDGPRRAAELPFAKCHRLAQKTSINTLHAWHEIFSEDTGTGYSRFAFGYSSAVLKKEQPVGNCFRTGFFVGFD